MRGVPQNSLRAGALRSNNCGKSDDEASLSFGRLATPHPAQRRRGQKGGGWGQPTANSQQPEMQNGRKCKTAGNAKQPEMQNSRCAIVALGCFSWAEADASDFGFGGVAQEIDLVFHVGGQPLGAVLDGAQGMGHHVGIAHAVGR